MPSVLVRNLTAETHRQLLRRARERGQSLEQYLADELTRLAGSPTIDDVRGRIERSRGGRVGLAQAVADLTEERPR